MVLLAAGNSGLPPETIKVLIGNDLKYFIPLNTKPLPEYTSCHRSCLVLQMIHSLEHIYYCNNTAIMYAIHFLIHLLIHFLIYFLARWNLTLATWNTQLVSIMNITRLVPRSHPAFCRLQHKKFYFLFVHGENLGTSMHMHFYKLKGK